MVAIVTAAAALHLLCGERQAAGLSGWAGSPHRSSAYWSGGSTASAWTGH